MKQVFAFIVSVVAAASAHAQTPHKYAIVSLAGANVSVLTYVTGTGTNQGPNNKQVVALNNPVLDDAAIKAATAVIKKSEPDATVLPLLTMDAQLLKSGNAMFDEPDQNASSRERLASMWQGKDITHVIVVTPGHGDVDVKFTNTSMTMGKADGIGFFVDNEARTTGRPDNSTATGLVMPLAYLHLRLVDAKTLQVVKEVSQKEARILTPAPTDDANLFAWNNLTPQKKLEYLQLITRQAVSKGLPKLLAAE